MKTTKLSKKGKSETAKIKDEIQAVLREIVMLRDGGCILRKIRNCLPDNVQQADHLVTRANSATYADFRLVVQLCRNCHGWKHWNKEQYDDLVRQILPKDRVKLWDRCMKDSWKPKRTYQSDWKKELAYLKQELKRLKG